MWNRRWLNCGYYLRTIALLASSFGCLGSGLNIWAQSGQITGIGNTTSTPVPGVPHDYITSMNEVVNPANGSLSIRIKAPTPHERGVNWPTYAFAYDSDGIYTLIPTWFTSTGSSTFTALTWLNVNWAQGPQAGGQTQNLNTTIQTGEYTSAMYSCQVTSGYVFIDPDGGRHGLGLGVTTPEGGGRMHALIFLPLATNT